MSLPTLLLLVNLGGLNARKTMHKEGVGFAAMGIQSDGLNASSEFYFQVLLSARTLIIQQQSLDFKDV
jgi:hypothetical protein